MFVRKKDGKYDRKKRKTKKTKRHNWPVLKLRAHLYCSIFESRPSFQSERAKAVTGFLLEYRNASHSLHVPTQISGRRIRTLRLFSKFEFWNLPFLTAWQPMIYWKDVRVWNGGKDVGTLMFWRPLQTLVYLNKNIIRI